MSVLAKKILWTKGESIFFSLFKFMCHPVLFGVENQLRHNKW